MDAHSREEEICRKHCRTFAEQMYGAITCVAGYRKATAAGARMCQGTFFFIGNKTDEEKLETKISMVHDSTYSDLTCRNSGSGDCVTT